MIRRMFLAVPLLLAACSGSSSPLNTLFNASATANTSPTANTTSSVETLQQDLPPGTSLFKAQTYMLLHGYTHTSSTDNTYMLNYTREEPLYPGITRQWHVMIYHYNGQVAQLCINQSVTSGVQARDASQWPPPWAPQWPPQWAHQEHGNGMNP
ncbi:MAG: hypothetical protein FWD61_16565 [Phycisphaerales bacterium]|nr:hypothetical protein [Phycisphaerales bacterium]